MNDAEHAPLPACTVGIKRLTFVLYFAGACRLDVLFVLNKL